MKSDIKKLADSINTAGGLKIDIEYDAKKVKKIADDINAVTKAIEKLAKASQSKLDVTGEIEDLGKAAVKTISTLEEAGKTGSAATDQIAKGLEKTTEAAHDATDAVKKVGEAAGQLSNVAGNAQGVGEGVVSSVEKAKKAVLEFADVQKNLPGYALNEVSTTVKFDGEGTDTGDRLVQLKLYNDETKKSKTLTFEYKAATEEVVKARQKDVDSLKAATAAKEKEVAANQKLADAQKKTLDSLTANKDKRLGQIDSAVARVKESPYKSFIAPKDIETIDERAEDIGYKIKKVYNDASNASRDFSKTELADFDNLINNRNYSVAK